MSDGITTIRHPSRSCVRASAALIVLGLAVALIGDWFVVVWLAGFAMLALAIGIDWLSMARPGDLTIGPTAPDEVFVGRPARIVMTLRDRKRRARRLVVGFDASNQLVVPAPRTVALVAESANEIEFEFGTLRRGIARVRACWLRFTGPLGLVETTQRVALTLDVPIVPDVRGARDEALRFLASPAFEATERRSRWIGQGSQFHALREFFVGADTRLIDWKSSARHRKLLMREFHEERNHQLVLAIDTGRLMDEPIDGLPRLDRAIVAALSLAVVALRSSDRVGLYGFDSRPRTYVEPSAGKRAWHTVRRATAALEYSAEETNFTLGINDLMTRLRRRTLVVVFTDFVDSVTAEMMIEHIGRLARRHVVIFVALADPLLRELRDATPSSLLDVHRAVVADDLARDREVVLRTLTRAGAHVIDARPQDVSARLLDRYLAIRRRELVG